METAETLIQDEWKANLRNAILVIREDNNASGKHLQKRLKISYGQAAKVLAHLENEGIVGPAFGNKPRVIHLDKLPKPDSISSALPSEVQPEVPRSSPPVSDAEAPSSSQVSPPEPVGLSADVSPVLVADPKIIEAKGHGVDVGRTASSILATGATSEIKLCVIAYLPPVRFNTLAFLDNLKRNPPAHPLITFSDDPTFKPTIAMKRSIEIPSLKDKPHGIANLAFYVAFGEAWRLGFTHFLYAEADMRVRTPADGPAWDEKLLHEFVANQNWTEGHDLIVGGTVFMWNPFKPDPETARRAEELWDKWNPKRKEQGISARNRPITIYGARHQKAEDGSGIGCNGAGAIYSIAGLRSAFPEFKDPSDNACKVSFAQALPYDHEIARRIWRKYGAGAFDRVAHLPAMFSSFADTVSTEEERLSMLRSGTHVLVHPIKSGVVE